MPHSREERRRDRSLPDRRLDEILAMIRGLENVDDVSKLTRMLVPRR